MTKPRGLSKACVVLGAALLVAAVAAGQEYEVLARYDFDAANDLAEWDLEGPAEGAAFWDALGGGPEPGSARFEVVETSPGYFTDVFVALGPCLPSFPLGQGYTLELVGQRRTVADSNGNASTTCEMGFGAYDQEPICTGPPDAWTTFPPSGANPWYPGPFLPYELLVPQVETRFLGQRVRLVTRGERGESCWFDSIEVRLLPPTTTIPTLSPLWSVLLGLGIISYGVWALLR